MGEGKTGNQERNIMILFLSNLHGDWLKQKDSVTGRDRRTNIMKDDKPEQPYTICVPEKPLCKETNEAPLADAVAFLGKPLDAIFYFSTKQVGMYPPQGGKDSGRRITALFPPDFNVPKEYDSEAHFFWTERAPKVLGDKFTEKTRLFPVAFDESAPNPVQSTILSVKAMEDAIRNYLREEGVLEQGEKPLTNCHLYVDVTGGIRTANMAMSAVMQLLVYQDAKLDRVMYSDFQERKVSDVQPIADMYKLVAGVDAFTKYGSSAALNEYFADTKKDCDTLRELLDAMNAFSESVLLCQPNDIVDNLGHLVPHLENFKENLREEEEQKKNTPPAKISFFERMIDELTEIYTPMYPKAKDGKSRKEDRIAIIHWCVRNTLLQQALSFCTEWLPEYLIEHGVIYVDDLNMQRFLMKNVKDKEHDSLGKKHFLMKGITGEFSIDSVYEKPIQDTIRGLIDKKIDKKEAQKILPAKFVNDFIQFLSTIQCDLVENEKNNKRLKAVIKDLIDPENKKQQKMKRANIREIHVLNRLKEWLSNMDKWYRGELFGLPKSEKREAFRANLPQFIEKDQGGNAARLVETLLRCNILETSLTIPEAVYFIETYTNIRILRNKVDHVDDWDEENDSPFAQEAEMSLEFIGNYLANYLNNIDKLETKPKPHFTGLWAENTEEAKP